MTKDYYIMRLFKLMGLDPADEENVDLHTEFEGHSVLKLITLIEEWKETKEGGKLSFASRCGSSF